MKSLNPNDIHIIQDMNLAISVMYNVGVWATKNGKDPHFYFNPKDMNAKYLIQHVNPDEFYVVLFNQEPTASCVLQEDERNQSWKCVDKSEPKKALYIHWLAVNRDYAGMGLSKIMIDFAIKEAKRRGFKRLRLDTDANEPKLTEIYKRHGFNIVHIENEDSMNIAFFEMEL